jgi:organic hydroperoxide reductase OsmC/OhrA
MVRTTSARGVRDGKGTNPEELLDVAHAGCFSMALMLQMTNVGFAVKKFIQKQRFILMSPNVYGLCEGSISARKRQSSMSCKLQSKNMCTTSKKYQSPQDMLSRPPASGQARLSSAL